MSVAPITESNRTLAAMPRLAGSVNAGLLTSRLPQRRHNQAARCAVYLHRNGFLTDEDSCADVGGYVSDREMVKLRTKEAITELQEVGLLPSSLLGWVLSFAVRWMFTRFIETLLVDWLES